VGGRLESPSPCFTPIELCNGPKEPVGGCVDVGAQLGDLVLQIIVGASVSIKGVEADTFRIDSQGERPVFIMRASQGSFAGSKRWLYVEIETVVFIRIAAQQKSQVG
jgi:hypothetical protein